MFCPQCGANQSDELRFCNLCGANLQAVRQAVQTRDSGEKFEWGKTWVAEMMLSETERKKRLAERECQRGVTPDVKRYNEIKAGVITSCAGLGVTIFLFFLMQGIIASGQNPPGDAEILSKIWIAGVIPFLIGLALIINGLFVSKHLAKALGEAAANEAGALGAQAERPTLRAADTSEFVPTNFSVTEGTTKHLGAPKRNN
ncbi:MAG TPA: zinc ribbon domain-containing protein [Pyrinomonadaceae bacterium]|jgi:hypothetical protein|nr:zinc ribbon domain-containing protein [Pyrinomonadaceae bacterium]